MIIIDPKILEQLEGSTCFGIAHDASTKECKMCDLAQDCAAKSLGNNLYDRLKVLKPETQKALDELAEKRKEKEATLDENGLTPRQQRKKRKREERERIGMPDTKLMTVEEMWSLLEERGGECKVYDDPKTQKMRLTIALKKSYQDEYDRKMDGK